MLAGAAAENGQRSLVATRVAEFRFMYFGGSAQSVGEIHFRGARARCLQG